MQLQAETAGATDDLPFGASAQLFLGSALFWFVLSSLVGLFRSVQALSPGWSEAIAVFQPDRLQAVYRTGIIFLWLSMGFLGGTFYILPRLLGVKLWNERLGVWNAWLWNLFGVLAFVSLLGGQSQGRAFAELVWPLDVMLIGLVLMALFNILMTIQRRLERKLYISVWYLTAALLWFPLAYGIGNVVWQTGNWWDQSGAVAQPQDLIIHGYYLYALFFLWLTPLATGLTYYFVPTLAHAPLYSRTIAALGFWSLALLGGAGGQQFYLFAEAPMWLKVIATVSSVGLLIPFLSVFVNLALTLRGSWARLYESMPLKFCVMGLLFYLIIALETAAQGVPGFNRYVLGTTWTVGYVEGGLVGGYSLWLLGAVAAILPALVRRPLAPKAASEAHFWLVTGGFLITLLSLQIAALVQSAAMRAGLPPGQIAAHLDPYWVARSVGAAMILAGAALQAWHTFRTAMARAGAARPTPASSYAQV